MPGPDLAVPAETGLRAGIYWPRVMRRVYQGFFLALFFLSLAAMTDEGIRRLPVAWLLHLDPLSGAGTLLSAWMITSSLLWGLAILVLTVVFGRAFCGWICPVGTLHHIAAWLTRRLRRGPAQVVNRWRPHFALKYLLLLGLLVAALSGTLATGLLDPLSLAVRSFGSSLLAATAHLTGHGGFRPRLFIGAFFSGGLFIALLAANRWVTRWWCRALCPLGALLGWVGRFSIFRIKIDPLRCNQCGACARHCQGADEPFGDHRVSECHVCLNCVPACPSGSISFAPLAPAMAPKGGVDLPRRQLLGAGLAGAVLVPLLRAGDGSAESLAPEAIRPPGARGEEEFLARCVRCGACVHACPTAALQPAMGEAGLEGLYTPILVPRRGWCEPTCTLCGRVCPTGAIRPLTPDDKGWTRPDAPGIKIGTAFFDPGRCLPWAMNVPCIVCEEVCPTSPKAIWLEEVVATQRDGRPVRLQRPRMDPARCVGCGLCEAKCPVADLAAVRVSRIGESRSPAAAFTLKSTGVPS